MNHGMSLRVRHWRAGAAGGRRALPRDRAAEGELEGAAGFLVARVGVGIGGVGGELDFHAAVVDLADEQVALGTVGDSVGRDEGVVGG